MIRTFNAQAQSHVNRHPASTPDAPPQAHRLCCLSCHSIPAYSSPPSTTFDATRRRPPPPQPTTSETPSTMTGSTGPERPRRGNPAAMRAATHRGARTRGPAPRRTLRPAFSPDRLLHWRTAGWMSTRIGAACRGSLPRLACPGPGRLYILKMLV